MRDKGNLNIDHNLQLPPEEEAFNTQEKITNWLLAWHKSHNKPPSFKELQQASKQKEGPSLRAILKIFRAEKLSEVYRMLGLIKLRGQGYTDYKP